MVMKWVFTRNKFWDVLTLKLTNLEVFDKCVKNLFLTGRFKHGFNQWLKHKRQKLANPARYPRSTVCVLTSTVEK